MADLRLADGIGAAVAGTSGTEGRTAATLVPAEQMPRLGARRYAGVPVRSGARTPRHRLPLRPGRRRCGEGAPDFDAAPQRRLGRRLGRRAGLGRIGRAGTAASVAGDPRRAGRRRPPAAALPGAIASLGPWPRDRRGASRAGLHADRSRPGGSTASGRPTGRGTLLGQGEDQVAYRGGERRVARLRRLRHGEAGALGDCRTASPTGWRSRRAASWTTWRLRPVTRQKPGPGQVEIRVRATGLNFRDVLNVLDLYPGDPGPLGGECAGEIVAVGAGVEHFKPGDRVVALAPASFASYALTLAEFVAPKPDAPELRGSGHDPDLLPDRPTRPAPAGPNAAGRARADPRRLRRRRPGRDPDRPANRRGDLRHRRQPAQTRVPASRWASSTSWIPARSISPTRSWRPPAARASTWCVNSLTGEAIAASLSVLRAGGRFLELGKTDLWDQTRVDQFRPGVTFHRHRPGSHDGRAAGERRPTDARGDAAVRRAEA